MTLDKNQWTYYRIPLQNRSYICPLCGKGISKRKNILCQLHSKDQFFQSYMDLQFCDNCGIPSGDGSIPHEMFIKGRLCSLEYFRVSKSDTAETLNEKMHTAPKHTYAAGDFTIEIEDNIELKSKENAVKIGNLAADTRVCPKCGTLLADDGVAYLPLNNKNHLIVKGRLCKKCRKVYVSDTHLIKSLIYSEDIFYTIFNYHGNSYQLYIHKEDKEEFFRVSKGVLDPDEPDYRADLEALQRIVLKAGDLNSDLVYMRLKSRISILLENDSFKQRKIEMARNASAVRQQQKEKPKDGKTLKQREIERFLQTRKAKTKDPYFPKKGSGSYIVKVTVEINGHYTVYSIVNERSEENRSQNILHYSDEFARELMTAAFMPERRKRGEYNGKKFRIDKTDSGSGDLDKGIVVDTVWIKHDGGMSSSTLNMNGCEIVDLMLYSPYTGRYELIKATQEKYAGDVYVDIKLIRDFVEQYGNPPGVNFEIMNTGGDWGDFSELNDESIMKELGYTVSKDSGLSQQQRRELLGDIVDLKILTVSKIISMLKFFIAAHKAPQYLEARLKWTEDMEYIMKYRVNPSRFLIASKVKR